jgi:CheY-like chemotaxis protein
VRVLIVEDNANTQDFLEALLREEGYDTDRAGNGHGALVRLAAFPPPDVVLLDLVMPGMDGFTFLRELRANRAWRDLPVIVQTAADTHTLERVRDPAYRPLAVLQKPWEAADLLALLHALRGRGAGEGGGA